MMIYTNKHGQASLMAFGEMEEVLADTTFLVTLVYKKIGEKSKEAAEDFKNIFKDAVKDDLPFKDEGAEVAPEIQKIIDRVIKGGNDNV